MTSGVSKSGALLAISAYVLWGLFPLYWKALDGIPLWEILSHRVIWSSATILLVLVSFRRLSGLSAVARNPRQLLVLGVTALLIGTNWSVYIYAIHRKELLQASLGYYANPLMSVCLGVVLLREKLNRPQIIAVVFAGIGVLVLGWQHQGIPWIAIILSLSFAFYGFAKKKVHLDTLSGLAVETLWLAPVAALYLALKPGPQAFASEWHHTLLLIGTGAITLTPLIFFNAAAKKLPLSTLGFFQYLSPSIQLLVAVILFHEPFTRTHAAAFALIWVALGLYSWDAFRRTAPAKMPLR